MHWRNQCNNTSSNHHLTTSLPLLILAKVLLLSLYLLSLASTLFIINVGDQKIHK
jgi:hypothetical protein